MSFHVPERFRFTGVHRLASDSSWGNNGAFFCKLKHSQIVKVIASDGLGWEHVSVSRDDRIPTWDEMCQVKSLFWDDEDAVMQLHPPQSDWVNNHSKCLHLWRPVGLEIPLPPSILVGHKSIGVLA